MSRRVAPPQHHHLHHQSHNGRGPDEGYSQSSDEILGRRSKARLDDDDEEVVEYEHRRHDLERFAGAHYQQQQGMPRPPQHRFEEGMMRYTASHPEVDTRAMMRERRPGVTQPTMRPSAMYMERHASTTSSTSVDSTIRRAEESMRSFQRTGDAVEDLLKPEEVPVPPCPAKPVEPNLPLRTSRRCLERVRQEMNGKTRGAVNPQTTFVVGISRTGPRSRNQEDLLISNQFVTVSCESCNDELLVSKFAVMVECPKCRSVGAATCTSRSKSIVA